MQLHEPENTAFQQLINAPVRVVVVGGTSVGKTTLVNAWSNSSAPTGLGSKTLHVREQCFEDRVIIDTPSLDEGFDIFPVAHGCDVLVWVVDGLRPISQTEATRIAAVRPLVGDCLAIVSRADLLPTAEYTQVMDRCTSLFDGSTLAADLRHGPPTFPHVNPLRTRRRILNEFVSACLAPLQLADSLVRTWRKICRETTSSTVITDVEQFHHSLRSTRATLGLGPPTPLPTPAAPALATPRSPQRAQWCMDGELNLTDWLAPLGPPQVRQERSQALAEALRLMQGLPPTLLA